MLPGFVQGLLLLLGHTAGVLRLVGAALLVGDQGHAIWVDVSSALGDGLVDLLGLCRDSVSSTGAQRLLLLLKIELTEVTHVGVVESRSFESAAKYPNC